MTDTEPDLAAIRADQAKLVKCHAERRSLLPVERRLTDVHVPALLDLVEQQAATIAHYDTALIEATRDLDRARRHIADLDGQIEGQDQALGAADLDRDEKAAEIERLRAELGRAQRAVRAFPTPIEVLAVDRGAGTASVIVVGWHLTRPVEIPLGPIVTATGIAADDLPGRWLEADVNCYAAQAADLVIRRIVIAPDLPPELMTRDASRAPESPAGPAAPRATPDA